jgi:hypothetical protein
MISKFVHSKYSRYKYETIEFELKEIILDASQLRIIKPLTDEYLETKKKIESGFLVKYRASQDFKSILK